MDDFDKLKAQKDAIVARERACYWPGLVDARDAGYWRTLVERIGHEAALKMIGVPVELIGEPLPANYANAKQKERP